MLGDLPLLVWAYINQHVHRPVDYLEMYILCTCRTRTAVATTLGEKNTTPGAADACTYIRT